MVFYRKYRSQTINDLDSQAVREKLMAVLMPKNLSHAFLFTGPKGLGKTSTARIIAKAVNCERNAFAMSLESGGLSLEKGNKKKIVNPTSDLQPQASILKSQASTIEPCNKCQSCLSITNGTNLDVIEIDAASNRGIDEIRELKEKINLAPMQARRKVYIIDEVHMLTTEAFNALLKTLEEPPEHAIFILCTTEQHKIPATILSRCFHIAFQPATNEELVRAFNRVIVGEQLKITDDALQTIAGLSEGGFRDGIKLLEEVAALAAGQEITKKLVEEKLHVAGIQLEINALLEHLQKRDVKMSLAIIEKLVEQKVDILYFLQKVMEQLHGLLLQQIGIPSSSLQAPASKFQIKEIQDVTELLAKAYQQTRSSVINQLPLELAIIAWCVDDGEKIGAVKVEEPKKIIIQDDTVSVSSLRKHLGTIAKVKALYGENAIEVAKAEVPILDIDAVTLKHFKDGEITSEWMDVFWKCIINEMKKYNHTAAGVLRSCRIKEFDRKKLVIEAGYQFHLDRLNDRKVLTGLEEVCRLLVGSPVKVTVTLKPR